MNSRFGRLGLTSFENEEMKILVLFAASWSHAFSMLRNKTGKRNLCASHAPILGVFKLSNLMLSQLY